MKEKAKFRVNLECWETTGSRNPRCTYLKPNGKMADWWGDAGEFDTIEEALKAGEKWAKEHLKKNKRKGYFVEVTKKEKEQEDCEDWEVWEWISRTTISTTYIRTHGESKPLYDF